MSVDKMFRYRLNWKEKTDWCEAETEMHHDRIDEIDAGSVLYCLARRRRGGIQSGGGRVQRTVESVFRISDSSSGTKANTLIKNMTLHSESGNHSVQKLKCCSDCCLQDVHLFTRFMN